MTRSRLGAWLWAVRPLYFLSEVVVAARLVGYSFVDDSVSPLGAEQTSPWHLVMNGSFVGYGALMAAGALLLHGRWGRSRLAAAATALLVLAGLSSIATGLVPLDRDATLHFAVALPVFVAQPLALLALARLTWDARRRTALLLAGAGLLSAVGGLGFALLLDAEHGSGLVERAALWPTFVALAGLGVGELRSRSERPGGRSSRCRRG